MHWAKLFSVPETHPCGTPIDALKLRWQVIVDIACVRRSKLKVVKKRQKVASHSFCSALSLALSLSPHPVFCPPPNLSLPSSLHSQTSLSILSAPIPAPPTPTTFFYAFCPTLIITSGHRLLCFQTSFSKKTDPHKQWLKTWRSSIRILGFHPWHLIESRPCRIRISIIFHSICGN